MHDFKDRHYNAKLMQLFDKQDLRKIESCFVLLCLKEGIFAYP